MIGSIRKLQAFSTQAEIIDVLNQIIERLEQLPPGGSQPQQGQVGETRVTKASDNKYYLEARHADGWVRSGELELKDTR